MVSRHYQTDAMFYTIGFGITGSDSPGGLFQDALTGGSGDEYARAILNPTPEYVQILSQRPAGTGINAHLYGRQLFALLNNQPLTGWINPNNSSYNYIWVGQRNSANEAPNGLTNRLIPVTPNPYLIAGRCFSYATASYISAELSSERITAMMAKTVGRAPVRDLVVHDMLQPNTLVRFTDYLGEGMEVHGAPVLRHEHPQTGDVVNHTLQRVSDVTQNQVRTETYRTAPNTMVRSSTVVRNSAGYQTPVYADLNQAEVRVITQADGTQSLEWNFPESLLPAYRKSFWFDYYFEMLPIRLIYQVRLSDEATLQAVRATDATFFVGEWESRMANVTFSPSSDNPFYANPANIDHTIYKLNNVTEASPYSLVKTGSASSIMIQLGNNGRIDTDNFVDNPLPDTGGAGRMFVMFSGLMVILAGGSIFARLYLKNTKKFMGGN